MKDLGRVLTAMVTPFTEDGAVDYEQAKRLASALLDSGSDGVVVVGTTGESPTLVRNEELKLFSEIKSAIGERGSVIAGTGSNSTAEDQSRRGHRRRCLPIGSPLLQQADPRVPLPALQGHRQQHQPALYPIQRAVAYCRQPVRRDDHKIEPGRQHRRHQGSQR